MNQKTILHKHIVKPEVVSLPVFAHINQTGSKHVTYRHWSLQRVRPLEYHLAWKLLVLSHVFGIQQLNASSLNAMQSNRKSEVQDGGLQTGRISACR